VIHSSGFPVRRDRSRRGVPSRVNPPLAGTLENGRGAVHRICGDVRRGNDMTIDYEVTYIIRPSLEEADVDARVSQLADSLKNSGGEVGEIEKMGKRRLAYEIDDVREGYYVVMKFKSDAAQAKELERQMRLNDDVMRALVIRLSQ